MLDSKFIIFLILLISAITVCGTQNVFAENRTVTIPFGASNPHFETEAPFWYTPPILTIHVNDTIVWLNSDREVHTVTSGKGVDRGEFSQGKMEGKPDGYFDSGPFKPSQSLAFTFDKPGTFYYFCTIHPWMNGAIVVSQDIPDYATDAEGNKINKWPVVKYTDDKMVETDLSWEPHIILTGEQVTFVFNFYNPATSSEFMTSTPYRFVIVQNGTEIFSSEDSTQYSGAYKYFVFNKSGPVEFRLENIGNMNETVRFSTFVFDNPSEIKKEIPVIQPARNLQLGQETQIVFVGPPIAALAFIIIWAKWGDKFKKKRTGEKL
ncbi:Blue (Type1) copper domain-containing protein [Nitrosotalea sinensis]|uniref:Blue (Type1) copper domain-containing protein n=1 Tax=Nitrosotalea sinensis TaxID=1499975 RepID=A0A2H1EGP7_9ARCH|nr:plastocyanin/azurin family copper-binding protein [Candidatus Nitrosotalea sinensis]SHO45207.1 Blue (Type1) copper domain-containing protein [Candidatus Nitrosotalea sinensis]